MEILAHVKWFEDPARYPLRTDLIFSERTALLLLVGGGAVLLLWLLSRLLNDPHWPRLPFFRQMAEGAPTLLAVQSAVALVHIAVAPSLLAPHLRLPLDAFGVALAAAQLTVAFAFVTGLLDWVAALLLIGLWLV